MIKLERRWLQFIQPDKYYCKIYLQIMHNWRLLMIVYIFKIEMHKQN